MSGTPFDFIHEATREHRRRHHCDAYTFKDGAGLIALVKQYSPMRILELGSALGFTACCLASSGEAATVDTVEGDPEHVRLARANIEAAGLQERITVHQGPFDTVLTALHGPYELAFFDGLSPSVPLVERLRGLLTDGGVLVCANLRLADDRDRQELLEEFSDARRWSAAGAIENGGTRVFRKMAAKPPDCPSGGEAGTEVRGSAADV